MSSTIGSSPYPMSADDIDLSARELWEGSPDMRERAFAVLRRHRPVSWQRLPENPLRPHEGRPEDGYWAVVRHDDVVRVSRDPASFCSGLGVTFEDVPPDMLTMLLSILVMDDPDHRRLRRLLEVAFSADRVRRTQERIRRRARQVVDDLAPLGECDFVEYVASRLPMSVLFDLWGVADPDDRARLSEVINRAVGGTDRQVTGDRDPAAVVLASVMALRAYASELAGLRRRAPGSDLMTDLVKAELDGQSLTDNEIAGFFAFLAIAAYDTPRHAISHTMKALCDFPDQRRILAEDLAGRMATATKEFVRWSTPAMLGRRTATNAVQLADQQIRPGDKVVLFYTSANRDEAAFDHPERFDVLRSPNRHIGFGGGGPHYCLGNQLARTQLDALFSQLLTRLPDLEVGQPEYLMSYLVHGVKHMPCRFTPTN